MAELLELLRNPQLWDMIAKGTWETLYMVLVSAALTVVGGLPLGILLVVTDRGAIWENRLLNPVLGVIVNVGRSIPFVILMVAVSGLTRFLLGTSIGTTAAIVPLTIAAIPFMGRVVEQSLREVDSGLIEAAMAMGSTNWQIIAKVLIPEALSSLIRGTALMLVNLVGYTTMAGVIGGGGLGDLAVKWGWNRYRTDIMLACLIVLVVMVQVFQWIGDKLAARFDHK